MLLLLAGKRWLKNEEIDGVNKQMEVKTHDFNTDLDLDLSLKLFGSEMFFLTINDENQKYSPNVIVDKIFDALDQGIEKAKHFEVFTRFYEYSNHSY